MTALVELPGSREMPRKRWTREEFHRLAELDWFHESGRYELIEGEIVAKVTQKRPHIIACTLIFQVMIDIFGRNRVQSQASIRLNEHNEPEPDITVLRETVERYREEEPGPEDILLAVEVSDTTLRADTTIKTILYGRAGIPEYWVVHLNRRTLIVHRQPIETGYQSIVTFSERDTVSPLAAPAAAIPVADLLPPV